MNRTKDLCFNVLLDLAGGYYYIEYLRKEKIVHSGYESMFHCTLCSGRNEFLGEFTTLLIVISFLKSILLLLPSFVSL